MVGCWDDLGEGSCVGEGDDDDGVWWLFMKSNDCIAATREAVVWKKVSDVSIGLGRLCKQNHMILHAKELRNQTKKCERGCVVKRLTTGLYSYMWICLQPRLQS